MRQRSTLEEQYHTNKNLVVVEMVYNGFFGKGNNITYKELNEKGFFNDYPYKVKLTREQFKFITHHSLLYILTKCNRHNISLGIPKFLVTDSVCQLIGDI